MVKGVLISLLLAHSVAAVAAGPCATASTGLTQSQRTMFARSISSNLSNPQPPSHIKVEKAFTIANWTAVWATPANSEQGVFFYSKEKSGLVYHDVWGGVALPSEQRDVAQWVMKLSPTVPASFAQCFAHKVTAGD